MPFSRPTLKTLKERSLSEFATRLNLDAKRLLRSVIEVLSTVLAGAVHGLYGFLVWISRQVMIDTAEKEHLERWASIWNVRRKQASPATGKIVLIGDGVVPAGTLLRRDNGALYVTTAEGLESVPIEAQTAGAAGNAEAAAILSLVNPVPGIQSSVMVDAEGLSGGSDIEDDESLRARLLDRIRQPPAGGAKHDYIRWALEVPGVTRAWCLPLWMGEGTVGVAFVRDNDADIFPNDTECLRVQQYIEELRPVCAHVYVFAPIPHPVNIVIRGLSPATEEIRTNIVAEVGSFFRREGTPGSTIWHSRLDEAISFATGEHHHRLVSPASDVVLRNNEMPVCGAVFFE